MEHTPSKRSIRSYVLRTGRMTPSQKKALDELWTVYGVDFNASSIDLDSVFGRTAPRTLEIGFGNGETLIENARLRPERDLLGIEVHQPGVGHVLIGIRRYSLENVRVICHDAVEVLDQLERQSLDDIQLFFPDPWHKKRHHKRRIVTAEFVTLVASRLKPGGRLHMATDWQDYAEHMLGVMAMSRYFDNAAGEGYSERPVSRPVTKFEHRGQRLGHEVWDLIYVRNERPVEQEP